MTAPLRDAPHRLAIVVPFRDDGGADIIFTDYGALRSLLQIAGVDDFPEAPAYADKLDAAICFCLLALFRRSVGHQPP